jgi:hypothetical protein
MAAQPVFVMRNRPFVAGRENSFANRAVPPMVARSQQRNPKYRRYCRPASRGSIAPGTMIDAAMKISGQNAGARRTPRMILILRTCRKSGSFMISTPSWESRRPRGWVNVGRLWLGSGHCGPSVADLRCGVAGRRSEEPPDRSLRRPLRGFPVLRWQDRHLVRAPRARRHLLQPVHR